MAVLCLYTQVSVVANDINDMKNAHIQSRCTQVFLQKMIALAMLDDKRNENIKRKLKEKVGSGEVLLSLWTIARLLRNTITATEDGGLFLFTNRQWRSNLGSETSGKAVPHFLPSIVLNVSNFLHMQQC